MAGATLDRKLNTAGASSASFALATQADDADIRRLLRENPMRGQITLTFEREPDYFADARLSGADKQTVVASEGGCVVCVGSCSIRDRFVNGQPHRVGYLGELRLDARATGRFDILRRGYEYFREIQIDNPADFYFTSIASDNLPARNLLERGLPGMPTYEFIGEFVTVLLPVPNRPTTLAAPDGEPADISEMTEFLNLHGSNHQFATCWATEEWPVLSTVGLRREDFHVLRDGGCISACAALWDQRTFKQTVIRGYSPWLAMARPAMNVSTRIVGTPRLPAVGSTLEQAFVSPFGFAHEGAAGSLKLVKKLQVVAAGRKIAFLTLGLAANDPRLGLLRSEFRCREYHSRIYIVRWRGLGGSASKLDKRSLGPEVALL